jgi:SAM-dependent methyltransferase
VCLVRRPLIIPDELHRNAPDVHASGPENTGSILMNLVVEKLGLKDLSESDVLDVGCGVRFTQAIINRDIPIKSYTGVDVHRPLIEHLQREVEDPRFSFAYWDAQNARYNPEGVKITPESRLPVEGTFDIIWLFSVFTHLDSSDANAMLAILRRHVRPGGALFFSAFLDDTVDSFEDRIPEHPLSHPCYAERYLRELIEANGWRVASVSPPSRELFIQHHLVCYPVSAGSHS